MKKLFMTLLTGLSAFLAIAQEAQSSLASYNGNDKLAIARSSIDVPAWHEKTFWPLYESYITAASEISTRNARMRQSLANVDDATSKEDAALAAENVLRLDFEAMATKRDYYQKIGSELNGIISLQFLQGEIVMDMLESSKVYESSPLSKYRFHPKITSEAQLEKAKRAMIRKALGLTPDNGYFFFNIYIKYEEEVNALLGEEYSLISFYAGDPGDFTPALAKRLGQDALSIMEREIKLKEKYYKTIKEQMGPVTAAKFLAWEDYYSLVSKMHAWADAP
jgi:hypothetical protein